MGHDTMPRLLKGLTISLTACFMLAGHTFADDITPDSLRADVPLNSVNFNFETPELNQSTWIKSPAISKAPHAQEGLLTRAKYLVQSGRLEAALLLLKTAIKLDGQDYHTWNALGEVYHGLGNAAQAMKAFNKAHALDPELATTCEYG